MSLTRPCLRPLALAVASGLALSILIAWAGAFLHSAFTPRYLELHPGGWRAYVQHGLLSTDRQWFRADEPEGGESLSAPPHWGRAARADPRPTAAWSETAYGSPFRCLWKWQEEAGPLRSAIPLPDPARARGRYPGQSDYGLPIGILWTGLLADSLAWGAVALLAPLTIRAARARLRLRRNRCPSCGYSLAGQASPGCPECGWARAPRAANP